MNDLVRLWKDPEYRLAHGEEAQAHPAGLVPLEDGDVPGAGGLAQLQMERTNGLASFGCCVGGYTQDWRTCDYSISGTICIILTLTTCQ